MNKPQVFCPDVILTKSWLDERKIKYKLSDLQKTPLGLGYVIKTKQNKDCDLQEMPINSREKQH